MVLTLNGEINHNMLNRLANYVNLAQKDNVKLNIYLDSSGGEVSVYSAMADIINNNYENIHLVGYGQLMSAAFYLFFDVKCTKELLPFTTGMTHYSSVDVTINTTGSPVKNGADDLIVKEMKISKTDLVSFHKDIGLNSKEIKQFTQGKDVYFSYKRMKELLNGSKVKYSKKDITSKHN